MSSNSSILAKIANDLASLSKIPATKLRDVLNTIVGSYVNKDDGGLDIKAEVGYDPALNITPTTDTSFATRKFVLDNTSTGGIPEPTTNGSWLRNKDGAVYSWVTGVEKTVYDADIANINNQLEDRYTQSESDSKYLATIKTGNAYYQQNKILLQNNTDIVKVPQMNKVYTFEDGGATSVAMNLAWATTNNLHTEDIFIFENRRTSGDVTITADGSQVYFYIDGVDQVITLKPKQAAMLYRWSTTAYLGYSVFLNKETSTGGGGGIPEPTTAGNFLRTNTGSWVGGVLKSVYDTFVSATNTALEQKIDNIWTQELQDLYPTTGEVALNDTLEEVVNKLNNSKYNGVDSEVIFGGEFLGAKKIVYITSPTGQAFLASNTVKNSIKGRLLITNTDIPSSGAGFGVSRGVIISPTALTVGATYVLGQNGDFINIDSIPEQNDIYLKIVGHAVSASQLYFNPESDYYELTTDSTGGTVSWSSLTGDPSSNTALMALFNNSMSLTEGSTTITSSNLVLTTTNDKDIVNISTTGAITINTITAPTAYFKKEIIFPVAVTGVTINASLYHSLKGTFTNGVVNKLTIQKLDNSGKYFLTW